MSASAADLANIHRLAQPCMDIHSFGDQISDMPLFNSVARGFKAPLPKSMPKRRASPLRDSPIRQEEETSDFPTEQLNDDRSTTSHPPEDTAMEVEQADWGEERTESETDKESRRLDPVPEEKPKIVLKPVPPLKFFQRVDPFQSIHWRKRQSPTITLPRTMNFHLCRGDLTCGLHRQPVSRHDGSTLRQDQSASNS